MGRKELILLLLIFLGGCFLRLFQFGRIPPLMHYDEASFAYNAWSILKTGRDEFGNFLPLNIRAFDDWRPPLYTYLTALFFGLFGVNDGLVRLPSALAGMALIIIMYFFARDFLGRKFAFFACFLTAFNPSLINFSRACFDSNLALSFTVLSLWFVWRGLTKQKINFLIGGLFFTTLSILSYQASKIFLPLMLVVFVLVYWSEVKKILKTRKNLFRLGFFALLFAIPACLVLWDPNNLFRFTSISIFNQENLVKTSISRLELNRELNLSIFNPFANRRLVFFQESLLRYWDHYNPSFLFAPGSQASMHYLPNFAAFPFFELAFFLVGALAAKQILKRKKKTILTGWFFLAALPAAFLATAPQLTRILVIVPVVIFLSALGLQKVWQKSQWLVIILYGTSLTYLAYSLFVLLPVENVKLWQGNYQPVVKEACQLKNQYDKVYVSNSLERPYIFFLWFGRQDPVKYLSRGRLRAGDGLRPVDAFDNFSFCNFSPALFKEATKNLFIGLPSDLPADLLIIKKFGCEEKGKKECIWFGEIPPSNPL